MINKKWGQNLVQRIGQQSQWMRVPLLDLRPLRKTSGFGKASEFGELRPKHDGSNEISFLVARFAFFTGHKTHTYQLPRAAKHITLPRSGGHRQPMAPPTAISLKFRCLVWLGAVRFFPGKKILRDPLFSRMAASGELEILSVRLATSLLLSVTTAFWMGLQQVQGIKSGPGREVPLLQCAEILPTWYPEFLTGVAALPCWPVTIQILWVALGLGWVCLHHVVVSTTWCSRFPHQEGVWGCEISTRTLSLLDLR